MGYHDSRLQARPVPLPAGDAPNVCGQDGNRHPQRPAINRARTSQDGRPKSVEQDSAKPHAPHQGGAVPSAYTMMSFKEHRPGTAKGYQICGVTYIKDQPSEKCGDPDS